MRETTPMSLNNFQTIACLNEAHQIYLVQHKESRHIYVKKILDIYNKDIYLTLAKNPICGIPKIIALFEQDRQLILIENYVSGRSLSEIMDKDSCTLHTRQICNYGMELCDILNKLHSMNPPIVHRDIKPSNIIITEHGHVMLLDFNAAKHYSEAAESDTVLLGTQGYAAPEQYGFGSSTPKTDIYALGILLKELCNPLKDIPLRLSAIIDKCTQINPKDRYASVSALKNDLAQMVNPDEKGTLGKRSISDLLPPGFRTKTPWKMFLAAVVYLFFGWLCLSMEIKNVYGIKLWLERLTLFSIVLFVIFEWFNYRNIQNLFPPCRHRNKYIRIVGIISFNLITVFLLLVLLCIIEISFFQ